MSLFNDHDLEQFAARGMTVAEAERQVALLRNPPPVIVLDRPATIGDGIRLLSDVERRLSAAAGEEAASQGRVLKFVPASGAASRMFKELATALDERDWYGAAVERLIVNLDRFAFSEQLAAAASDASIDLAASSPASRRELLALVLSQLANLPKGLIPFHRRDGIRRTAVREHLFEAANYATDRMGRARIHFTIARAHETAFLAEVEEATRSESSGKNVLFDVSFSDQRRSTDTIAIDAEGNPFRSAGGGLLFRPGGHGALIENLVATGGDIVSIKNIDNVVPPDRAVDTIEYKKVLMGLAVQLQEQTFAMLRDLDAVDLEAALQFVSDTFARSYRGIDEGHSKRSFLEQALRRPLRVCGVVRNSGEPGGAPFWVRSGDDVTLQIVESSQVDLGDPSQRQIWRSSTHFNPVDVICAIRDERGDPYDLSRFIDHDAAFIVEKAHEGRALRSLERPGLWNGAMARWNTVCVEVPPTTFSPVKSVFDLLRPEHE